MSEAALRVEGLSKRFDGSVALDDASFDVAPGEVRALLGQNGSGKSTVVKALAGIHTPDSGRAWCFGRELAFPVRSAAAAGLAVIHQDLGLVESLSAVDNFGVTAGFGARRLAPVAGWSERRQMRERLGRFGLEISPDTLASELSPAARALLAIVRAERQLDRHGDRHVFVLDEPTTYLTGAEAAHVLALARAVANRGSAVVFISHRLQEVLDGTDSVTVLRDGRVVATAPTAGATQADLVAMMLGRPLGDFYPVREPAAATEVVLAVEGLRGGSLTGVSLEVRTGEIVGVCGLPGEGIEDLADLLVGVRPVAGGSVAVDGRPASLRSPRHARRSGLALVPGNRQRDGLWLEATATENLTLPSLRRHVRPTGIALGAERRYARAVMESIGVRPLRPALRAGGFSGGNQQKLVLGKWLQDAPRVLVLEEPTQGVDAEARREILEQVAAVARGGTAVVVVSGDFEQLAAVCHRVLVLRGGRVGEIIEETELSEERILAEVQRVDHGSVVGS